jgi:DNA-binding NtrC family response regulator
MRKVLLVDDKEENLSYLSALLSSHGFGSETAPHGVEALAKARLSPPDIVISDLLMPVMDGYTLLRQWKSDVHLTQIPFIIYTATYTEPSDERLALNLGADAFILKPAEPEAFIAKIRGVLAGMTRRTPGRSNRQADSEVTLLREYSQTLIHKLEEKCLQLEKANQALRLRMLEERELSDQVVQALGEEVNRALMFEEIVGSSQPLKNVLSGIVKVAPTDSTVLITGESGTGKELIARAIHKRSQRSSRPMVCVNCAALTPSLIASELFGHEKGAFTGADQRRLGRFELASRGTIFLDEIGDLPAEMQIALLRVLQEHQFERVGGNVPIFTDVRVIAATSRDLKTATAEGAFRVDLFYRLNVFPLIVPSLRDRHEDIPMLLEYFIQRYAGRMRKKITKIDKKSLDFACAYPWPGNIRELQNVVERSVILSEGDTLTIDDHWISAEVVQQNASPLVSGMRQLEKTTIEEALTKSNGRIAGPLGAAARLGIPPTTLQSKLKALHINKQKFRKTDFGPV